MFLKSTKVLGGLSIFLSLVGCANSSAWMARTEKAEKLACIQHFKKVFIKTEPFLFTSFQNFTKPHAPVTIYIEGDGQSWISRTKLSSNPTPRNPIGLKLALLDNSPNVAYLARPCQYTLPAFNPTCSPSIWSDLRFSPQVIRSMDQAISQIKKQAQAPTIHLVGFSGGAAIAVLIAANREDVKSLRTVAGDLNHEALSEYHHTTPLQGSLNPFSVAHKLTKVPQQHFVGEADPIVPAFISQDFIQEMKKYGHCEAHQIVLKGVTHHQGWEAVWPTLLKLPFKTP